MASDSLTALQALDTAILTEVVRQDQQEPELEVTSWTVRSLSNKGVINPDGLFLFSGEARVGETARPWSVVLKRLKKPDQEREPHDMRYWKRELLAFQSGLLARLPGPVAVPRFYGSAEFEDSAWLWMEHIHDAKGEDWTLDDYAYAARQLGQFNGAYLTATPLPNELWFCQNLVQQWTELWNPEDAWDNPFVSQHFSQDIRAQAMQLWTERKSFYYALDHLPQVFSHFDYMRRNLFIRQKSGQEEVVAIDWALCGTGAVGGDLYALVGVSSLVFEWEPSRMAELEQAVFGPYLTGLQDVGWHGNAELVRLGYIAWLGMYWGLAVPALTAAWCAEERREAALGVFGQSLEDLAAGWAKVCEFSLSRAHETQELMAKLLPDHVEKQKLVSGLPAV